MKKEQLFLIIKLVVGFGAITGVWWIVKCQCVDLGILTPNSIRDHIQFFGNLAALVYVAAYILNTISIVPPIAPLSLTAGLAFGAVRGAVLLMSAAMIGTSITFMISRFFGRGMVKKLVKTRFKNLDERLEKNGFMAVLFFRIVPLVPYEVLNYACGLSKIKFKDYFLATFFGLIPGVIAASFFGGSLGEVKNIKDIFSARFLIAVGLMVLIIAIPTVYQVIKRKQEGSS